MSRQQSQSQSSTSSSSSSAAVLLGAEDANAVETFIAFARVFSGVLHPNKPLFVLGPRYDPLRPDADGCAHVSQITRTVPLYMMMGRDLAPLSTAYAGNICGIGRLGAHILKTATLCSTPACSPLSGMTFQTTPLVRVCIEPVRPQDLDAVERGLALLNQADPCVELNVADNGEGVVIVVEVVVLVVLSSLAGSSICNKAIAELFIVIPRACSSSVESK